ncbi:hypothetical protein OP10G_0733 [Fimbriimonas ginsengisoli Gsoil 348]|uniref:Uncharacterized protein n=1 Tax=Fimbriimonas ginsengisoli Gsoil 348 TaxID=661478 RepID=A0A068NKV5_FIMGI|nr:hypothetical protein OP10G_0733 [Fimbriimonas ginsengisoli Gsoil 348]
MAYTDTSITWLDPITGREKWHVDLPNIETKTYIRLTGVFADRRHVVVTRLTKDSSYYETVSTFDAGNGALLANRRIEDDYGVATIDGESIRLFDKGKAKLFDHFGMPKGEENNFPWPGGKDFPWKGNVVVYTENEDFPLDFGDASGLRGLRLRALDGHDVWSDHLMRRQHGGEITTLDGKPASDFFGPPLCADDIGIWTRHWQGGASQLVRLLPSGVIDRSTKQPYVEYLVQWTDRGIYFRRNDQIWRFDGSNLALVADIPVPREGEPGEISRHGFIRTLLIEKGGKRYCQLRLDPLTRGYSGNLFGKRKEQKRPTEKLSGP